MHMAQLVPAVGLVRSWACRHGVGGWLLSDGELKPAMTYGQQDGLLPCHAVLCPSSWMQQAQSGLQGVEGSAQS